MTEQPVPLRVDNVTVAFQGLKALSDVSLTVPPSSIVGLIGPNGAGKTTMFNAITGLVAPAGGRVYLYGRDVTTWPQHRRARLGVGRTFQRLELFSSLTVAENLIVGYEARARRGGLISDVLALPATVETRADAHDRAREVMALVGVEEHATALAGDLPIGLARLVELGRALCTAPRLLLLDEPSSGLSSEESGRLARLLSRLRRDLDMSILVVEHDMAFVLGICDSVTVLDFGRLLATGTPAQVRADPAVQAAYLGEEVDDAAGA